MSLSQHDAVPLIDVIDGEQLYIHLLQTGHHTVGNVKLLQRRQRTANGHPVEPIGLHQLIFRGYGCAGQVFFFFDLTADHLAQLDIKRGFIADFTHDRMPRFLRGGER